METLNFANVFPKSTKMTNNKNKKNKNNNNKNNKNNNNNSNGKNNNNNDDNKWSNLPKDILNRILLVHLNYKSDLTRLRAVCPNWRAALSQTINELPKLFSNYTVPYLGKNGLALRLYQTWFHFLSPVTPSPTPLGGTWLARMGDIGFNKWHLFNPLVCEDYFSTCPPVKGSMNLLNCRVLELFRTFLLVGMRWDGATKGFSKKVVGGWNFAMAGTNCALTVLVELNEDFGCGLVLWRMGDDEWTKIEGTIDDNDSDDDNDNESDNNDDNLYRIVDIAFYKDRFYVFELSGWRIGVIDPAKTSPPYAKMEFFAAPDVLGELIDDEYTVVFNDCCYFLGGMYLVPSNERLYLVIEARERSKSNNDDDIKEKKKSKLFVFVLKEEKEKDEKEKEGKSGLKWERVHSLGDEIMFIGYDASFVLPSASVNLPQWKPGSICLFTHPLPIIFDGYMEGCGADAPGAECLHMINFAEYFRYLRMYEMGSDDGEGKYIVPFEKLSKEMYTGLFFPPPPWVKWRCPKLGNVEIKLDGLEFRGDMVAELNSDLIAELNLDPRSRK